MSRKRSKSNKSRGTDKTGGFPVTALAYGFLILLMIAGVLTVIVQAANHPYVTPTPIPTAIALPTSTPDPDPIITCNIHARCGGGSRQMRKSACDNTTCCFFDTKCGGPKLVTISQCNNSICCQVGSSWSIYPSSEKCTQAQNANNPSVNQNNNTYIPSTYTPPTYYTCTLYYPALHTSTTYTTLYQTKADCDAAQASLNQGSQPTQIQTAPVDNTANNQQCKATASQTLSQKEQAVEAQYGGTTGTASFIIQNQLIPEYNQAVANCNIQYPI